MRVPYEWLREYCAPDITLAEVEQLLTISGTKVEAIHHHGVTGLESFVVGRVLTCEQHPDADRLRVCTVDVGGDEPSQIVCGAPNVAAGQTVGVARPGAVMPDGTKLKKAKLRGVESNGMILAEDEVGIGQDHAGIMELETEAPNGSPLAAVIPISTDVIEFEITPNRPDCLGIYGIARELHAATGAELRPEPWAEDPGTGGKLAGLEVDVQSPDLCPRFTARVFEDVTIAASPRWLKARLMAAGLRPINNVVDITNYVMLLTGQPLHAFDLDKVAGGRLVVRNARDGERIETLDGETRTLDGEMVVIEDADGPTSIAGIMGGARSEISPATTRVALEVATWIGHNIKRTSNRLALRSEASGRFEKGLAPEQALWAQAVATKLLVELTGARVAPGTLDAGPFAVQPWPEQTIVLREQRVSAILGMEIPTERQRALLQALGFTVEQSDAGLAVTVPGFRRNDVTREADLIEEVARFELDGLPATLPKRRGAGGRLSTAQQLRRRAVDVLVGRGAYEAVGWSFTDAALGDRLRLAQDDPRRDTVVLANPMSEEHSELRSTLLGSLLDVARLNAARGTSDLVLCEQGAVYQRGDAELPHEHRALGALAHGHLHQPTWTIAEPTTADFFTAKALLGAVLDTLRIEWSVRRTDEPFLHPGRAAEVLVGDDVIGWVGELHPLVCAEWDLGAAAAFEIDLDRAVASAVAVPHYADVSVFPPVRRDLALTVDRSVTAGDLVEVVRASGGALLADAGVFDVYEGAQVGEGKKSIALRLVFQALDRTLADADVDPAIAKIVKQASDRLGAQQRV
ncbi:MAG TPA: phenylalanine--tRNA ligase subunit beta [Baekduia sp.]|nr:phenylalanine--tRNA ligase subunit beta [Baekduia sp.]